MPSGKQIVVLKIFYFLTINANNSLDLFVHVKFTIYFSNNAIILSRWNARFYDTADFSPPSEFIYTFTSMINEIMKCVTARNLFALSRSFILPINH